MIDTTSQNDNNGVPYVSVFYFYTAILIKLYLTGVSVYFVSKELSSLSDLCENDNRDFEEDYLFYAIFSLLLFTKSGHTYYFFTPPDIKKKIRPEKNWLYCVLLSPTAFAGDLRKNPLQDQNKIIAPLIIYSLGIEYIKYGRYNQQACELAGVMFNSFFPCKLYKDPQKLEIKQNANIINCMMQILKELDLIHTDNVISLESSEINNGEEQKLRGNLKLILTQAKNKTEFRSALCILEQILKSPLFKEYFSPNKTLVNLNPKIIFDEL